MNISMHRVVAEAKEAAGIPDYTTLKEAMQNTDMPLRVGKLVLDQWSKEHDAAKEEKLRLIFNTSKSIISVYHRVARAREGRGTTDMGDLGLTGLRGCPLLDLAYGGRQSDAHRLEHFAARPFGLSAQAEVFLLVNDLDVF